MTEKSPRQAALEIITRFETGRDKRLKADVLLNDALNTVGKAWSSEDRGFCTALTYGVLRQWVTLDFYLQSLSRFPVGKIQPKVRSLLRLGLYQLQFMNHVPDYAALDTTVALAKSRKLSAKTLSFINGLLRSFQRRQQDEGFPIPGFDAEPVRHLALTYALPDWFAEQLLQQYGPDAAQAMAALIKTPPPVSLRVNTLKTTITDYQAALTAAGLAWHPDPNLSEVVTLDEFAGSPQRLPGYAEGHFYVQDPSSAQVAHWVDPQPGERILDLCAAPGSKTTHMAALMQNTGSIVAVEPVSSRVALLKENLARLGVDNVEVVTTDGLKFSDEALFDKVLVDAPCSGLGTVRKHPEILLQMKAQDLTQYPPQQLALLEKGLSLLKPGGQLIYSTCSLDESENQAVIQTLLQRHGQQLLLEKEQPLPIRADADGFYIARLTRA